MHCSANCVLSYFFGPNFRPRNCKFRKPKGHVSQGLAVFPFVLALHPETIYVVFLWNDSVFTTMHMRALQCTALQTVCLVNFEVLRICPILTEKTKDGGLYAQIISLFSCGIEDKFTH